MFRKGLLLAMQWSLLLGLGLDAAALAQGEEGKAEDSEKKKEKKKKKDLPLKAERSIEFSTDEATWISLDPAESTQTLSASSKNTGETQNVFFRLTLPTGTASINEHGATITIVAVAPP